MYCCISGSALGGVRGINRGTEKGNSTFDTCELVKKWGEEKKRKEKKRKEKKRKEKKRKEKKRKEKKRNKWNTGVCTSTSPICLALRKHRDTKSSTTQLRK
jgi:hypothetical protein